MEHSETEEEPGAAVLTKDAPPSYQAAEYLPVLREELPPPYPGLPAQPFTGGAGGYPPPT